MYRAAFVAALLLVPSFANAATLYIAPGEGTYGPGDTFIAEIRLNSEGDCINAAEVTLSYPKEILKAVDFSRGDSIFSLFVSEPTIHPDSGTVSFSGGIPGGYCGRIQGDPALSNILGKVVFTVVNSTASEASVAFVPDTALYANDGLGTKITPTLTASKFKIAKEPQLKTNAWIDEVKSDTLPPEPFSIQVESTKGVFSGKYYIVFSTLDKQSGLDHYEIFERGSWVPVTSPHELQRQSFLDSLQVRAVDKAGNIRIGDYVATSVPQLQAEGDLTPLYICLALFVIALGAKMYLDRRKKQEVELA